MQSLSPATSAPFPQLRIPDSARRSWLRRASHTVVTASRVGLDHVEPQNRIVKLERQAATLRAVLRLLVTLVRTAEISLANIRVPSAVTKSRVLRRNAAEPIIGRQSLGVPSDFGKHGFGVGPTWRANANWKMLRRASSIDP